MMVAATAVRAASTVRLRRVILLVALLTSGLAALAAATSASAATDQAVRQWGQSIRTLRLPAAGCFDASYPAVKWHKVRCVHAPPIHTAPSQVISQDSALRDSFPGGAGDPYSAEVPGAPTITSAVGSFPSVSAGATEEGPNPPPGGPLEANAFTLQLNSEFFSGTPVCSGGTPECEGWQQFVYSALPGFGENNKVYMEYWLINYLPSPNPAKLKCPSGWGEVSVVPRDCYKKGSATELTGGSLTISGLTSTSFEARANSGGNDEVVMATGSGKATAVGAASVLDLYKAWKLAEFDIYGPGNGSQAEFSPNTTITVNTVVKSSSDAPPICRNTSYTAESNNLTLEETPALSAQSYPTISSQATNGTPTLPSSCATYGIGPPSVTLTTPPEGASYNYGQKIDANYTCAEATGATLESCIGTLENGEPINTATLGSHTFTVTAKDTDGQTAKVTHTYTVNRAPTTLSYTGATSGVFDEPFTLSATLTDTESGVPLAGQPVTLAILGTSVSCTESTNAAGEVSCPFTPALFTPGSYTIEAGYGGSAVYEATSSTATFVLNKAPTAITYTGETKGVYHDPFNAQAVLRDTDNGQPLGGQPIEIVLGGTDGCSPNPTTNALGEAGCSITPTLVPGPYAITASFAGDADYLPSGEEVPFTLEKEPTTTRITSPGAILEGGSGATLSGTLVADGTTETIPIEGRTLTLTLGSEECEGTTDASGTATCKVPVTGKLGPEPLTASFAGDAYYLPSSESGKTAIVFSFPSHGAFVLGDVTAATPFPAPVEFWGADWSTENLLTGGLAPPAFKGFASTVQLPTSTPPGVCAGPWTTRPGNSSSPPPGVPSYMGVLVASSVSKSGSTISGNTTQIVVVETESGYAADPGHHGTGTVVAAYC